MMNLGESVWHLSRGAKASAKAMRHMRNLSGDVPDDTQCHGLGLVKTGHREGDDGRLVARDKVLALLDQGFTPRSLLVQASEPSSFETYR